MHAKVISVWLPILLFSVDLKIANASEWITALAETATGETDEDSMTSSFNDATSVWRVENDDVVRENVSSYAEFDSGKVYIIIHQVKSEREDAIPQKIIFYWVGDRASKADAVFAATYVVSYQDFSTVIRREAFGLESDSFKAIFKIVGNDKDEEVIEVHTTRMILIERLHISGMTQKKYRTKEVEFSLEPIQYEENKDACCVAFNSYHVYTYCAYGMDHLQRDMAKKLQKILLNKVVPRAEVVELVEYDSVMKSERLIQRISSDFDRIMRKINDHNKASPKTDKTGKRSLSPSKIFGLVSHQAKKSQTSNEQGEKQDSSPKIDIFHIYKDRYDGTVKELKGDAAVDLLFSFRREDCYLVDSGIGHIGILAWLGWKSGVDERTECARRAETLLRERANCVRRPVIIIDQRVSDIEEFPEVFGNVQNLVDLMVNLHVSWEDIIMAVGRK